MKNLLIILIAFLSTAAFAATTDTVTPGNIQNVTMPDGSGIASLIAATNAASGVANNSQTTKAAAVWATTAALPANTYNNGTLGVGATLTGVSFGALTVDGGTPNIGDRILVKNEGTAPNNGIYSLTVQGAVATLYILTRTADYNNSSNIIEGDQIPVVGGTANTNTTWELTETTNPPVVVGTTALNFFSIAYVLPSSANFNSVTAGQIQTTNPIIFVGSAPLVTNLAPALLSSALLTDAATTANATHFLLSLTTTSASSISGSNIVWIAIPPISTNAIYAYPVDIGTALAANAGFMDRFNFNTFSNGIAVYESSTTAATLTTYLSEWFVVR